MINSTYNPARIDDFDKSKVQAANQGVLGVITAGNVGMIDLPISDDHLLTGLQLLAKGSAFGDHFNLQLVDLVGTLPNGLAFPPNTLLSQFGTSIYVADDMQEKLNLESNYPAKIYAGLVARIVYTSTGTQDVQIAANWRLHKVLV